MTVQKQMRYHVRVLVVAAVQGRFALMVVASLPAASVC